MKRNQNSKDQQEPLVKKSKKSGIEKKMQVGKQLSAPETKSTMKKIGKTKYEKSSSPSKVDKLKKPGGKILQPTEKTDWREFKKEKKELKEKRKTKKLTTLYDVSVQAKKINEKLKRINCSAEDKIKYTNELHQMLKGKYDKLVFGHDMARVLQALIKHCTPEVRDLILREMMPIMVTMIQSKYAKNCVQKAFKYGSDELRQEILSSFNGHIVKLVSHTVASPILDIAYKTYATKELKNRFKQEFYGDMFKQTKNDKIQTLTDVFDQVSDMKSATLAAVKMNLVRVLNKNLVTSAIVQSVLMEFLAVCSAEDRNELIVMLRNSMFELSQSKEGSKIAMICIWHGTTKDRKFLLKALKDHVKDIAMSEHGNLILMAIFDSIDDTVLMKKILIPELLASLQEIILNEHGRKVISYLVARRDPKIFHPSLIAVLKEGDGNAASKKPEDIRAKELLEAVIDSLLESIANDTSVWLANSSIAMVTLSILKAGHGEKLIEAFNAISEFLINSELIVMEGSCEFKVVEHPGLHMMFKKLIAADKDAHNNGETTFGSALIEKLDETTLKHWAKFNRACFLLVLLLENESQLIVNLLKSKIKAIAAFLKKQKHQGASILLKKM